MVSGTIRRDRIPSFHLNPLMSLETIVHWTDLNAFSCHIPLLHSQDFYDQLICFGHQLDFQLVCEHYDK